MQKRQESTTRWLFQEVLDSIRLGRWPIGGRIPSERKLMAEFGVSRTAVREALSMLRALGAVETSPRSSSIVRKMDSEILGRLFPLMFSFEGEQTYQQIFEVRLALESRTSYLAALNRSEEQLKRLEELLELLTRQVENDLEESIKTDLAFHVQIARATSNPLFPLVLEVLSGFVTYVQLISCRNNPVKRYRALQYHQSIFEAIRDKDAERARVEMESHLRFSADRMLKSDIFKTNTSKSDK